jgi:hypothetical protein
MNWQKLGRIYVPDDGEAWGLSHAANPVAEHRGGDVFRIYFSTRDLRNRSSIGWIDIDITDPQTILAKAQEPALSPGDIAMFDDSGVSIGCIVPVGEKRYLYYMGWRLMVTTPWQNTLGLAVSDGPDQPFRRLSRFPLFEFDETDPYTVSYPWIMHDQSKFRMWYGSSTAWGAELRDMRHLLKYAESDDGVTWRRENLVAIGFSGPDEYAICKPCVVRDEDCYRMWFCSRGDAYRIYYAESRDGLTWRREAGPDLDVSASGWDSHMVEYPFVFDHKGERYMLYCGDGLAKAGFGLAILEQ